MEFTGRGLALTRDGVGVAAMSLATGVAEIWAVIAVETRGCGFLADRRPQILYERHLFHQLTGGRFDDGDVSDPKPGNYGPAGAPQYDRLSRALALDRAAALESTSWGLGQILGRNFAQAGFADVETMVSAMCASEDRQLAAVSAFITAGRLQSALAAHDWAAFASRYNGPSYAENRYDTRLSEAYQKYVAEGQPDLDVRAAQLYLTYLGYRPGAIDGVAGPSTRAAVLAFEQREQLPETGVVDAMLVGRLLALVSPSVSQ